MATPLSDKRDREMRSELDTVVGVCSSTQPDDGGDGGRTGVGLCLDRRDAGLKRIAR
jgi:hypothetical protein